ncbi:MAG: PAS domain S-box protein [Candidatus Competibacter sp.]
MNALLRQARRARAWIDRRLERRIAAYAITAILGTSLLFGAASLAATLWIVRQHQRIDSEHRLDRIVVRLDDKVDLFVRHAQDLSKSSIIATALLDSRGRNIYLLPFFSHYRFPLAEPHGLALCDFEGKLLAQQKWHPINCLADLPQSRAVIGAEQAQALVIAIERRPHLVLFQPVLYPGTGRAEGYILAALDLLALVTEKNLTRPNAILMLHSPGGTLDFTTGPYPELPGKPSTRPLFAAGPFAAAGLTLSLYEPSTLFAGFEYLLLGYGLGMLALTALALALSHQLARRIAEPLLILNRTAHQIAAQDPTTGLASVGRADEIGELAIAFNDMVAALRRAQDHLEAQVQARTEELQQALIKVGQSDEFTRAILDSMDSHIAVLDRDGVIMAINESWRRFALENGNQLGDPRPELGVNYLKVCREASNAWSEEAMAAHDGIQAVLAGRRSSFTLEYPCHSPRAPRWFTMTVTPLETGGGVVIAHTDITKRKVAEEALQKSELRFRTLFTASKATMLLIDPVGGDIVDANAAAADYYGYAIERLCRMKISDINRLTPEQTVEEMRSAQREKRSHFFFRHRLASGEVRDVEVHSGPLNLDDRSLLYSIIHDITDRKQAEIQLQESESALRESEARYRSVVDTVKEVIFQTDAQGLWTFLNPAWSEITGFAVAESLGTLFLNYIHPDDRQRNLELFEPLIRREKDYCRHEIRYLHRDGGFRWIEVFARLILDQEGGSIGTSGTLNDITERHRMEEVLRESEARFHTLVDLLPYGVQENDLTGRVTFANLALERLQGQWEGGLIGRLIWDFLTDDTERESLRDYLQFLIRDQPSPTPYFVKNRRANGDIIDVQVDWTYRRDPQGRLQGFIAVVTDITARKRMQEALREQAIRDPLTGLFNRRYLDETLPRELSRCQRSGEPLTVAMLDLDHFKRFNDAYGHEAGDVVLRSVGDLLGHSMRAGDLFCRYGGEELTLILHGSTLDDARARLESLRQAIMQMRMLYQGGDLPAITVSIGVAAVGKQEMDAAALLARADAALYRAKERGRNRVVTAGE